VTIAGTNSSAFTDIDGNPLTYRIYDKVDVEVTVTGSALTIIPGPNFNGLASFYVAAWDGTAESTRAPVLVRVLAANDLPAIDSTTPPGFSVTMDEGNTQLFSVTASDIDGDTLTYQWYNGAVGNASATLSAWQFNTQWTTELDRTALIRVVVSDGHGGSVERQWNVTIKNRNLPPSVNITAPTKTAFTTDEEVSFSAVGSDPDNDALTYTWYSNKVPSSIGSGAQINVKLPAGNNEIRLVVSDGKLTTEARMNLSITQPTPPPPPFLGGFEAAGALAAVAAAMAATVLTRRRRS
jgi:chitinase